MNKMLSKYKFKINVFYLNNLFTLREFIQINIMSVRNWTT